MGDNDDRADTEITEPILDEHGDVRRRFVELWNERTSGDTGAVALAAAWQPVENMLENHASAQADVADPVLLREGSDEASNGTNDAHPVEVERDAIPDFPEHSDKAAGISPVTWQRTMIWHLPTRAATYSCANVLAEVPPEKSTRVGPGLNTTIKCGTVPRIGGKP